MRAFPMRRTLKPILWFGRVVWQTVRLAVLAVLICLEPFVCLALTGLSACLLLIVFVFQVLAHRPGFPWVDLLVAALACTVLRMAYLFLIDVLRRR